MKKILLLLAVCILAPVVIYATSANEGDAEETYDEDAFGPEAPIIWPQPVKAVIFTHATHTVEEEFDCESCHDDIFEMEAGAAEQGENFTMQAMYNGASCGACHDGETAFSAAAGGTPCHIGVRGHARLMAKESVSGEKPGH